MSDASDATDEDKALLRRHGRLLVERARAGELPVADLRDDDARTLVAELARGRSVLLVGPDGVGRRSVLRAAAHLLAAQDGHEIVELTTIDLLAGTRYLGEWQTQLLRVLDAIERVGAVLHVTDLVQLATAGSTVQSGASMLDLVRPRLQSGRLTLLGEVSATTLQAMEREPRFVELFTLQPVEPLSAEQVDTVLERAAERAGLDLSRDARRTLVDLTDRFLPARPQPGPALDLLRRTRDYQEQKAAIDEPEEASVAFIERVFSIYAGLPRFVVSRSQTRSAADIRAWFGERIVGQREAIEAVVQAIALFKAGLHDPRRPLGTFLFVGPTGVGKTELARALATFLFGGPNRMLRFDLGEYKDHDSFLRLLGNPYRPQEPALLADAVRAQPFQVVLLDELEKAHPNLFDVLLGVLDEGRITTPRGEVVDLRSTFVICTSNAGAEAAGKAVGFGAVRDAVGRRKRTMEVLQTTFRPELLNRFGHIVPFHPLDEALVRSIARQTLRDILARDGITSRNLVVDVDDAAIDLVIEHGFDARWGARGLQRELQRRVVVPLAMTLMEHRVEPGEILKVTGADGQIRVRRLDTEASREARREAQPIQLAGRTWARADIDQAVRGLREDLEALSLAIDEDDLRAAQQGLLEAREDHAFWAEADRAARQLRDLDHITSTLDHLDRLRTRVDDLHTDLGRADTRGRVAGLAARVEALREAMASAWRELVYLGPDGVWDALVEVRPLGGKRLARDVVTRAYLGWADDQEHEVVWLHDPRADDECALFAVRGRYATGMLRLEAGVHRVVEGDEHAAARVRVAPWTDRKGPVAFVDHRALKAIGTFGGKVRSRLATDGLVLQNDRTLAQNRDLAVEVGPSWHDAPEPSDVIVRRYDLVAPLVRDVLTGETSGRPDALSPARFHALLCRRVEVDGSGPEAA
ncbi:MAG: AAA family ATPase [Alphaproteobacteria bacterium]|nr:AAA family ATPase [Alphaproteobacteria bacterium]